jgi:hypothetical protein
MNFFINNFRQIIFYFLIITLFPLHSLAEGVIIDSTKIIVKDTSVVTVKDSASLASKKRANKVALMSAIVPGLGQIANKKYWKLPIIYGGAGVLVYFIKTNNDEYKKYKNALLYRTDKDSTTIDDYPGYTIDDLSIRRDYYRRNRDLSYILAGVLYTLNIIDAYVDSQLMNFDVSDNLSIHTGGTLNYLPNGAMVPTLQLVFNLK